MTDVPWPHPDVLYEVPFETDATTERWQKALDAAITSGSMRMEPSPHHPDLFTLAGACPRCGHATRQPVEFSILADGLRPPDDVARLNFRCVCREGHEPGPPHNGCGWGGPVAVTVRRPEDRHGE